MGLSSDQAIVFTSGPPEGSIPSTTRKGALVQRFTNKSLNRLFSMMTFAQDSASAPSVPGRRCAQVSASWLRPVRRGSMEMYSSAVFAKSTVVRQLSS